MAMTDPALGPHHNAFHPIELASKVNFTPKPNWIKRVNGGPRAGLSLPCLWIFLQKIWMPVIYARFGFFLYL